MNRISFNIFRRLIIFIFSVAFFLQAKAHEPFLEKNNNTSSITSVDTVINPLLEKYGISSLSNRRNPFELSDTSFVKRTIEYDPVTKQYMVVEKIGNQYYKTPMTFSMKEFMEYKGRKDENDYFKNRADMLANMNRRMFKPKFNFVDDWVNRII